MNTTKLIGKYFASRQKAVELYDTQAGAIQERVMNRLVREAAQTEWGHAHHFENIKTFENLIIHYPSQEYIEEFYDAISSVIKKCIEEFYEENYMKE